MSLGETSKLLLESQKIFDSSEDLNTNTPVILNMLLQLVSSIDGRLKSIETAVDSIKDIKRELLLMSAKMRELEFKVSETAKSQKHVETSCQVLSDMFDDVKNKSDKRDDLINKHTEQFVKHSQDISKQSDQIKIISTNFDELKKQIADTKSQHSDQDEVRKLQNTVLDLQCRSMKNNLIFTNLFEQRTENVEEKLRAFIYEKLGIEHHIEFGNVHRFGKRSNDRPRPIVARFLYHKDLRLVLDRAKWLKNTPFGIHEQFPNAIEERRKKLYPIQKEARKQGKHVVLVRDKLFIDGMLYCQDENDNENTNATSAKKYGYRDSLLTTPKEANRPYKRPRPSDTPPVIE